MNIRRIILYVPYHLVLMLFVAMVLLMGGPDSAQVAWDEWESL